MAKLRLGTSITYQSKPIDTAGARFAVPPGYEPPPPPSGGGRPVARVTISVASTRKLRVDRQGGTKVWRRALTAC